MEISILVPASACQARLAPFGSAAHAAMILSPMAPSAKSVFRTLACGHHHHLHPHLHRRLPLHLPPHLPLHLRPRLMSASPARRAMSAPIAAMSGSPTAQIATSASRRFATPCSDGIFCHEGGSLMIRLVASVSRRGSTSIVLVVRTQLRSDLRSRDV